MWTFALTTLALVTIYFSYKSFLGIEAGVAVLSTFLFAKALETKNKRGIIVCLILLCLLVRVPFI